MLFAFFPGPHNFMVQQLLEQRKKIVGVESYRQQMGEVVIK